MTRLTKREKQILADAMECLTLEILRDEYDYEVDELQKLEDKIVNNHRGLFLLLNYFRQ